MKYHQFKLNMENNNSHSLILRQIESNKKVLEFGPATGNMTRYLKQELHCSVTGIEIDRESAEIAKQYSDKIIIEDIDGMQWTSQIEDEQFDYILFVDVLEHLKYPEKVLQASMKYLSKKGKIMISVPNIGHNAIIMELLQGRFSYQSVGLLDNTHIHFFTRKSVLDMLLNVGLYPIELLGTYALPDQTEFQQQYYAFPEAVRNYLKNREDAHIYQFVIVSERKNDNEENKFSGNIEVNNFDQSLDDYIQVYWKVNSNEFDESQSYKIKADFNEFRKYTISLPKGVQDQIRLDPTNFLAAVEIKNITLLAEINNKLLPIFSYHSNFDELNFSKGIMPLSLEGECRILCTEEDPQIIIDLPRLNEDVNYSLEYEVKITKNIFEAFKNELNKAIKEVQSTKDQLNITLDRLNDIYTSKSWKATAPFRYFGRLVKRIYPYISQISKGVNKSIIIIRLLIKNSFYYKRAYRELNYNGIKGVLKKIRVLQAKGEIGLYNSYNPKDQIDVDSIKLQINQLKYRPLISIVMPVYNIDPKWLSLTVKSVEMQLYENWELCITDDGSNKQSTLNYLRSLNYERIKIKFLDENKGISTSTNEAISLSNGDYVAFLDHDDLLTSDALFEFAKTINYTDADVLYSDEDKIDHRGLRHTPFYKPDWSPDLLRSQMYIGHMLVAKTKLVRKVGNLRIGFEGSQDYDLMLRLSEVSRKIVHIPKVLYSWRELESSTSSNPFSKSYTLDAGIKALNEHLDRVFGKNNAWAKIDENMVFDARYKIPDIKISIIIPTKDKMDLIDICINSILNKTSYPNYEIIILNNNSELQETFVWFENVVNKSNGKIKVIDANYSFNWSKLNNHGMKCASGEVYVFLNNDTIVITEDWLQRLAEKALRSDVGTVGALLLYEDGTIQHAGVVVGMGGWADHVFKGMQPIHLTSPFVSPVVTRNVSSSTGACLAVSRKTIEKIGGFNEEFIICGSDVEISLRALKFGLVNIYDPYVKLYHLESKTRSSFVPECDYVQSAIHYSPYREIGDPFYNQNLDTSFCIPTIK